jgi:hypothetical protein
MCHRGPGDQVPSPLDDRFLAVQRQMVQVLGNQHMDPQVGRGQSLVDDVRRPWRLLDGLAALADPLAADVALHRAHARLEVQLLGHVLADALHWCAAAAGGVLGLVADLAEWQACRQLLALGDLLLTAGLGQRGHRCDLGSHRRQVAVQHLFQQAALLGAVGLGLGGELRPLDDRVLVREFVDDGLLERDLSTLVSAARPQFKMGPPDACRGVATSSSGHPQPASPR